jgi:hypothetical protein
LRSQFAIGVDGGKVCNADIVGEQASQLNHHTLCQFFAWPEYSSGALWNIGFRAQNGLFRATTAVSTAVAMWGQIGRDHEFAMEERICDLFEDILAAACR